MMGVEELAWRMLELADQHRTADSFDFAGLDAAMDALKGELNFAAALEVAQRILEEKFPSTEVN